MKRFVIIGLLFFLTATVAVGQTKKKLQFIGGARSLVSHSNFTSDGDTVTAPKNTGGYALLDLGIKINPNDQTEVLGMFRINNDYGGFWGAGVSFDVRQLYVRGVAGNVVRYHIGNIDYKLTPYTFYNHNPDLLTNTTGALQIKEEILDYESFYSNHTWRQQGASAQFALAFPKYIQEMKFNGFISRLNPSNFDNILDRLYGGGNILIQQSEHVQIGLNHVQVFDLLGTAVDSNAFTNGVTSLSYDLNWKHNQLEFGVDGESGLSTISYATNEELNMDDYFIHVRGHVDLPASGLGFFLGYMDNGPDFRSFGAQSRRVDFSGQNTFYNRYTNDQIVRPISLYDLYNDPTLYRQSITIGLMDYNPEVNNVLPYGLATFNRRGLYVGGSYVDAKKITQTDLKVYVLSEIRGQGTTNLRNFQMLNLNTKVFVNKLINREKDIVLNVGVLHQNTSRTGEFDYEAIGLNSTLINAGVEIEVAKNLFVMGNVFTMSASGNEQKPIRDANDVIVNFSDYRVDGTEINISGGLRLNFSNDVYVAAFYEYNTNDFIVESPYVFRQTSIVYVMKF